MKKILAVFLVLIMGLSMAGCGDSGEIKMTTFASYEKGYEATAPATWNRLSEEDAGVCDLVLESMDGAASVMIFGEAKSDYAFTAEEYYDAVINMTAYELNTLSEDEIDYKDTETVIINGIEAKTCEFNYTDEGGLNMRFWVHLFETEDTYVRVVCGAKVSEFDDYRPVMQQIAESIVLK